MHWITRTRAATTSTTRRPPWKGSWEDPIVRSHRRRRSSCTCPPALALQWCPLPSPTAPACTHHRLDLRA